jgi:hypothetical protein
LIDKDSAENIALLHAAAKTGFIPPVKASIFRYVALKTEAAWGYLEQTVLNHLLPMTTPTGFNDPFEVSPNIVNDLSDEDVKTILSDTSLYRDEKIIAEVASLPPDARYALHEAAVNILRQQVLRIHRATKIASFSQRISSELLWAHYADGYRGLAYHFITSGNPNSVFHHLKPVQYVSQRPIMPMTEILEISRDAKFDARRALMLKNTHEGFFLHKSPEWAYEQELRVVLTGRKEESFFPEELASLIVGPYFPQESISRLQGIITQRSRPVRLVRSTLSTTDYAVDVRWNEGVK